MTQTKSTLVFVLSMLCFAGQAQTITSLGNEGVFIEYNGSKVLIDALFDDYHLKFDAPDESTMTKIMTGTAPYNGVDLVLVTHAHRDHFYAQIAVDYLNANQNARMIAPPQALDSMKVYKETYNKISSHIYSFPWKKGWKTMVQGDINIKTTYMFHAGRSNFKTQNEVYVIEIGGKKIIHLGDTQMERDNFDNLGLEYDDFDVAIVPFWYLSNIYGAEIVKKFMKSKKVIAVHFPKNPSEQPIDKIQEFYPEAILFTSPGKSTKF